MVFAPLKKHLSSISTVNIEEFCQWFRVKRVGIVTIHFINEDITVTIGLESEIEMLEEALVTAYLPARHAKLKEVIEKLAQ